MIATKKCFYGRWAKLRKLERMIKAVCAVGGTAIACTSMVRTSITQKHLDRVDTVWFCPDGIYIQRGSDRLDYSMCAWRFTIPKNVSREQVEYAATQVRMQSPRRWKYYDAAWARNPESKGTAS